MSFMSVFRLLETLVIAFVGGLLFHFIHLPLPWVLGALTFVMLWQSLTKRKSFVPNPVRDSGFIILGLNFGLYFTLQTFKTVGGYLLPYLMVTIVLILVSIFFGWMVSKKIEIDEVTSVFACIPGGLSEMTLASGALNGNSSYVAIFQTLRLIAVLFIVPSVMTYYFAGTLSTEPVQIQVDGFEVHLLSFLWFVPPAIFAYLIRNKVPAGIVIGALLVTALMNISSINLPTLPDFLVYGGQILVGASIGKNILLPDLKKAGKYGLIYFGLSVLIIGVSFALGFLLATFTSLNLVTAMLSIAPGGLFEMVLTSYSVGGDPAIVSALQLIRILVIVACVPPFLKWLFNRKEKRKVSSSTSA